MLMMLCAGAREQGVSQWASTFAEMGLGVSKTIGDLAGPMAFAILMGSSRAFYGKFGDRIDLDKFMIGSSILCIISYLCISLAPSAFVSLIGCSICGFSVGILLLKNRQSADRGNGLGKQLLQYGIEIYNIQELTVNEQNPRAADFYEHMGFQTYKRTDHDEKGNPYPLLYMRLSK